MRANLLKKVKLLLRYSLIGLAFLVPILFLPTTVDMFEYNKKALIIAAGIITLFLWALRMLLERRVKLIRSRLELPLTVFWLAIFASLVFSTNRTVSFTSLQSWMLLFLPGLYFVYLNNLNSSKHIRQVLYGFLFSGTLLSLWSIADNFKLLGDQNPNPAGSLTNLNAVSLTTLVVGGVMALTSNRLTLNQSKLGSGQAPVNLAGESEEIAGKPANSKKLKGNRINPVSLLQVLGAGVALVAFVSLLLTNPFTANPKPIILDLKSSWAIAIESVKQAPLFGTGINSYVVDFMRYKPLTFNGSNYWNLNFGTAANLPFQLLTENGFLGFLALVGILVGVFYGIANFPALSEVEGSSRSADYRETSFAILAGLVTSAIALLLFPPTAVTLFLFILMAALFAKANFFLRGKAEQEVQITVLAVPTKSTSNVSDTSDVKRLRGLSKRNLLPRLIFSTVIIIGILGFYFLARVYTAEAYFKRSLNAAQQLQGSETYNYQRLAINMNPYEPRYHVTYSNTNLALANAIAEKGRNEQLSDNDRTQLATLVQQAIREARVAVAIAPDNAAYHENLASIYRNLIGVAEGAEQWALNSYAQAISLNPLNPRLRIALGGVYYALEDYDNALLAFQDAIRLKSDYANAYYNLAWTLRQTEQYPQAVAAFEQALSLIPQKSPDYSKATQELAEFKDLASSAQTVEPSTFSTGGESTQMGQMETNETNMEPGAVLGEEEATDTALPQPEGTEAGVDY